MSGCAASVEIELDGQLQDVQCSQNAGHPEAHSAKIWWSSTDAGEVQSNG